MLKEPSRTPLPDQAPPASIPPSQVASLIAHLRQIPYPNRIVEVLADIPGPAFFPGGLGLVTADGRVGSTMPVGGIMVLGHNFDTVDAYKEARRRGGEVNSNTTWRNLWPLLAEAGISPEDCFFTNAFMGLLDAKSALGSHHGHADADFLEASRGYFLRQLLAQQPRTVLVLGHPAARFLGALSPDLAGWAKASGFAHIDRDGPVKPAVRFPGYGHSVSVAALLHPCLRLSNLRHRSYKNLNGPAKELEMLKDVLAAAVPAP